MLIILLLQIHVQPGTIAILSFSCPIDIKNWVHMHVASHPPSFHTIECILLSIPPILFLLSAQAAMARVHDTEA